MKKLMSTLAILATLFGIEAFGGHDGNGGFGIQCAQPVKANNGTVLPPGLYTLDYWDAIHNLGYPWGLGPANLPWQQKVKLAARRLSKYNTRVSEYLNKVAENPNKYINFKDETVFCGNAETVGNEVYQKLDIGSSVIPSSCKLVPIGKNIESCQSNMFKLEAHIFINPNLFARLNEDSKAAIVLHEAIYLDITQRSNDQRTSEGTRMLVALLGRADFDQLNLDEIRNLISETRTYGFDFIFEGFDLNGNGKDSLSIQRRSDDKSIKVISGAYYANLMTVKIFDKDIVVRPGYFSSYLEITRNNKFRNYRFADERIETLKLADGVFAKLKILPVQSLFYLDENGLNTEKYVEVELLELQSSHAPVKFEKKERSEISFPWGKEWGCIDVKSHSEVAYKGIKYNKVDSVCFGPNGNVRINLTETYRDIKGQRFSPRAEEFSTVKLIDENKLVFYAYRNYENFNKIMSILKMNSRKLTSAHEIEGYLEMVFSNENKVQCMIYPKVTLDKRENNVWSKHVVPTTIKLKDGSKKTFSVPFVLRFNEKEEPISAVEGRTCL